MRLKIVAALCASFALLFAFAPPAASADTDSREVTRDKLGTLLASAGQRSDVNVAFHQSTRNPYNFVGTMTGLANVDNLEIVISVTQHDTIGFRVYPHYKGNYINLGRAQNASGLMKKLLWYSDQNFLFWGADDASDVFCGYTFTLESGFPEDAIIIVLRSIHNTDRFVGQIRTFYDGSSPA